MKIVDGIVQSNLETGCRYRLGEEIIRPVVHGIDGIGYRIRTGYHNDLYVKLGGKNHFENFKS